MSSLLLTVFLTSLLLAITLAAPAWLLQASCAICGEKAPGFLRAFGVALLAAVVTTVVGLTYGLTVGVLIAMFSKLLAGALNGLVALLATATVYSATLRTAFPRAMRVAVVQWALSAVAGAVWWFAVRWLWSGLF